MSLQEEPHRLAHLEGRYVKDVYDRIASDFSKTRVSVWGGVVKFLDEMKLGSFVLDLGCGNGKNMERDGFKWYGLDQCCRFLEICEERFKYRKDKRVMVRGSLTDIPLESGLFDNIICIATFHHLASEENRDKSLKEMNRVMKFGGKGLITVWAYEFEKGFQWEKEIKRQGGGQDILIPWRGTEKKGGLKPEKEERYYHFFKKEEIVELVERYFRVEEVWFETNNWFIKFIKNE